MPFLRGRRDSDGREKAEAYMEFLNSYQAFMDDSMGTYMELDDAVKKTGLSAEVIVRISASAGALYQIGKIKIINLCEFDDYIRSFPVICDMDNLKSKRLRGSKFLREIYRNRQKR